MLADPIATGELEEQRAIEPAHGPVVDVLDRGEMPQFGGPGARLEALLLTQRHLVLEQDAGPFDMVERAALGVGGQIVQALGHAGQAKLVQSVDRRVLEHCPSPQW